MEWCWPHLDMGLSTLINTVWLSGSQSVGHGPFGDHTPDILHIRLHYITVCKGSKITVTKKQQNSFMVGGHQNIWSYIRKIGNHWSS